MRRVLTAALFILSVTACSRTPTSPTSLAFPNLSGVWQGEILVTNCSGARNCSFGIRGSTIGFVLRLSQTGAVAAGVLSIDFGMVIDVMGTVGADGIVVLKGTRAAVSDRDGTGEIELTRSLIRFIGMGLTDSVSLTGRLEWTQTLPEGLPLLFSRRINWAGDVAAGRRISALGVDQSFAGRWRGMYINRRCAPVGTPACFFLGTGELFDLFELQLSQTGANVSGTATIQTAARSMPVTGVVSGRTLALQGSVERGPSSSASASPLRITAWSTSRDELGRMHGTFSFTAETHWAPTVNNGAIWSENYDVELVSVVLQP